MTLATATFTPEVEAILDALVDDDTRELATPKGLTAQTTQNAYGYYMSVLGQLPQLPSMSPATSTMLWGIVLARSGGNEAGIQAAVKLLHG